MRPPTIQMRPFLAAGTWRVLLGYGFRPFFLLAALDALINMIVWLAAFFYPGLWPANGIPAIYWHAHEMLFGFVAAAVGGFLLTAVPGWTGRSSYSKPVLILLAATWLAGRLAMAPHLLAPAMSAVIDLAFFPTLALVLAPSLIRSRKFRNLPFIVLLLTLFLADLCFQLGVHQVWAGGVDVGLGIALDVVTLLIVIVGGRIIPAFTKSGLAHHGISPALSSAKPVEILSIGSILAMFAADMVLPLSALDGVLALVAGLAQATRLAQWHGHRTARDPLIWVLHLGYAWLSLGFILKAIWLSTGAPFAEKWIHAFTIGAFTTMILAVMTRASLGHTGRALIAPRYIATCYGLISAAAIFRVFGSALLPSHYGEMIAASGLSWIAAFCIFLWVYLPILIAPRADGRPG